MAAASNHPLIGLRLAQRYQLVDAVARGGISDVYRGDDLTLRRPVIIKAVPASCEDAYRAALHTTAALSHPATVAIYDAITQDRQFFLVQEFVPGYSLATYVRQGVPSGRAVDIALQLVRTVAYAHKHGIVHGDLTPAAVLVDRHAIARLNNFGLPPDVDYFRQMAEVLRQPANSALQPDGESLATPREMGGDGMCAQAAPSVGTAEHDVWAVGLLLWQLVTTPISAAGAGGNIARRYRPDVPAELRGLVDACIAGVAAPHIADAEPLAIELERMAHELAAVKTPLSSLTPPALRAARDVAARAASWSVEETLGGRRRMAGEFAGDSSALGAPTDPITMDPAATRATGEFVAVAASRLRLPSRPFAEPTEPQWAVGERSAYQSQPPGGEQAQARPGLLAREGLNLLVVLLLGAVLFVIFFLIGFYGPPL